MTKNFNPLLPRARQGLEPLPQWLFSLSGQRELLRKKGLKEITVSNDKGVWITVEPIKLKTNEEPTLIAGVDVRGDRKSFVNNVNYNQDRDPEYVMLGLQNWVTLREQKAYEREIASRVRKE
jgi:hypothetical protein